MKRTEQIDRGLMTIASIITSVRSTVGEVDDEREEAAINAALRWIQSLPPATGLLQAELTADGGYKVPYAALEPEQLWVGFREVWTSTHGRARRYHVMYDGGVALCRRNQTRWKNRSVILLNQDTLIPIRQMPAHMACLRNGCRQIFEAFVK